MNFKQILFEERFKFNLELLNFPEENSIGWRLAFEMTEEEVWTLWKRSTKKLKPCWNKSAYEKLRRKPTQTSG